MTFLEFAQTLPKSFSDQEFVDHLNKIIDLRALQDLTPYERQAIHDAAQYLSDYMLLISECKKEMREMHDVQMVDYRGPFIANSLSMPGQPVDHEQLQTLGVGGDQKYFG